MVNSLTYNGYTASITHDSVDEVFYGKVKGTVDLILFEGTSDVELKLAFKHAIDDYLEFVSNMVQ